MKKIACILVATCFFAASDTYTVTHDSEPGEQDYAKPGAFETTCFLLTLPVFTIRFFGWAFIDDHLPATANEFLFDHEIFFLWLTDAMIVFLAVGAFYGVRCIWRQKYSNQGVTGTGKTEVTTPV